MDYLLISERIFVKDTQSREYEFFRDLHTGKAWTYLRLSD